jgi:mono/diheme cytochrome c family protein
MPGAAMTNRQKEIVAMHLIRGLIASVMLLTCLVQAGFADEMKTDSRLKQRGKYLSVIAGCNDCHTPGYAESGGKVPEQQWLIGTALGWSGPWGTTYAVNLRLYFQNMTAEEWIKAARNMQARPPMPSYAFRIMSEGDLRALYSFAASLGPTGKPAPRYAPPGQTVSTPVVRFPAPVK